VEVAQRLAARVPGSQIHLFDSSGGRFPASPGLRVHAPRPYAEVAEALSGMDAALCLYRSPFPMAPGFYLSPLKLFEAMGAGLPVVASARGQISEVVEQGRTGWLVGDDPDEVTDRLAALARDVGARRAMGAAALDRIRTSYTWGHVGQRIDAVIRETLTGYAAPRAA